MTSLRYESYHRAWLSSCFQIQSVRTHFRALCDVAPVGLSSLTSHHFPLISTFTYELKFFSSSKIHALSRPHAAVLTWTFLAPLCLTSPHFLSMPQLGCPFTWSPAWHTQSPKSLLMIHPVPILFLIHYSASLLLVVMKFAIFLLTSTGEGTIFILLSIGHVADTLWILVKMLENSEWGGALSWLLSTSGLEMHHEAGGWGGTITGFEGQGTGLSPWKLNKKGKLISLSF